MMGDYKYEEFEDTHYHLFILSMKVKNGIMKRFNKQIYIRIIIHLKKSSLQKLLKQ